MAHRDWGLQPRASLRRKAPRSRSAILTPSLILAETIERLNVRVIMAARHRNRNARALANLDALIEHLKQDDPILTNGPNVRAFEREWNEWLGTRYSVFVNSGASARTNRAAGESGIKSARTTAAAPEASQRWQLRDVVRRTLQPLTKSSPYSHDRLGSQAVAWAIPTS